MLRGKNVKFKGGGSSPVTPPPPVGPQYYAANAAAGSGSGLDAANPCLIASAWAIMSADAAAGLGPTLNLANGTYTGANSMIVPTISGTVAAPVVVRATNEGQVLIDGQGARPPVLGNQVDYINLIGVNAKNSSVDVVGLTGCIGWLIQRVCAWDAADFNRMVFANTYGVGSVFEDCAGWGIARKTFQSYATAGPIIFRRCWGKWSQSTNQGPKMAFTIAYHSYNHIFENCLATWDQVTMPDPYTVQDGGVPPLQAGAPGTACNLVPLPYGVVQGDQTCSVNTKFVEQNFAPLSADSNTALAWNPGTTYPAAPRSQAISTYGTNAYYSLQAGNINHRPDLTVGVWWNLIGPTSQCNTSVLGCISYQRVGYNNLNPARLILLAGCDSVTLNNCVGIYPSDASFGPTTPAGSTRQPIVMSNGQNHVGQVATNLSGFRGLAAAPSYSADWASRTNCISGTTPLAYYPGGQSLYSNDGAHGATIRYRYVNGLLTSTALWPWPMSARILAATTASGYTPEDVDTTIQGFFGTYI